MRIRLAATVGVVLLVGAFSGVVFAGSGPCFYNPGSIQCAMEKCLHTAPYDNMPTLDTSSGEAFEEMSDRCLGVIRRYCSSHMDKWPCPDFSKWLEIKQFSPTPPKADENLESWVLPDLQLSDSATCLCRRRSCSEVGQCTDEYVLRPLPASGRCMDLKLTEPQLLECWQQ